MAKRISRSQIALQSVADDLIIDLPYPGGMLGADMVASKPGWMKLKYSCDRLAKLTSDLDASPVAASDAARRALGRQES